MQKSGTVFSPILLLFLFFGNGISSSIFAQNKATGTSPTSTTYSTTATPSTSGSSSAISSSTDTTKNKSHFQPSVRFGIGMLSYIGNIPSSASNIQNPSIGRVAYDFGISDKLTSAIEISLNFLFGSLGQTEKTTYATWNFQSSVEGGGINFLYKILPKQNVSPFILIGIESYKFLSKANIYDQYGTEYYGWSDGTLRSLPESSPEAPSAKVLTLGYPTAANIDQLNIGGEGNYSQQALAIPVGIGFMFHVISQVDFMVGTTLHYTSTQSIDGLAPKEQGTLKNDMFAYTYATLRINFNTGASRAAKSKANNDHDNAPLDPSILKDTVHPDKPGVFDTSSAAIKLQYEKFMDTTGQFAQHYIDTNHWRDTSARAKAVTKNTSNRVVAKTTPSTLPVATNTSKPTTISTPTNPSIASKPVTTTKTLSSTTSSTTSVETVKTTPAKVPIADNTSKTATTTTTTSTTSTTTATIATNTTSIASATKPGLVFKIPLGVFRHEPDQDFLTMFNKIPNGSVVKDAEGLTHYTAGSYNDYASAQAELAKVQAAGLKSAFIMAFYNGNKISIQDALNMLKH